MPAVTTAYEMSAQQTAAPPDHVQIIPFCAPLPSHNGNSSQSSDETFGVVGTITLRGPSAVVWFGWGDIEITTDEEPSTKERRADELASVGTGNPPMGSLSLSMPLAKSTIRDYVPSTQLLGGSSEEDMILGQQISARLAKRVGWPIFVSCSFNGWGDDSGSGEAFCLGLDVSPQLAAAVAEKEVARILIREKERMAESVG